jgi:hypothetical protein
MSASLFFSTVRPFGDLPVVRRGGRWLLTAGAGAVPADRALAGELDRFAVAMVSADKTVAAMRPHSGER